MVEKTNSGKSHATEIEGRVSTLEAGQQAIQEDIRELAQVVTDLAHETRRTLGSIQRPNWQYLAVLLGVVLALGSIYNRDQTDQDTDTKALMSWQLEAVREAGHKDGLIESLSEQVQILRSEVRDLRGGK